MLPPAEIPINDSRAHRLLVIYTDSWYLVPSQEAFSRHSGTCLILGDKKYSSAPYKIQLGDCFRLGSVGVVVSEIKCDVDSDEQRLDARKLQYLKDEALAFDIEDDIAVLASDEEEQARHVALEQEQAIAATVRIHATPSRPTSARPENCLHVNTTDDPMTPTSMKTTNSSPMKSPIPAANLYTSGIANGEKFVCYMCYETHDTPTDPLVAPCECKGDTRYLHVQCLQKWYQSSIAGPQARVIRTTGSGAPACKICGHAYKTTFRRNDGKLNLITAEFSHSFSNMTYI